MINVSRVKLRAGYRLSRILAALLLATTPLIPCGSLGATEQPATDDHSSKLREALELLDEAKTRHVDALLEASAAIPATSEQLDRKLEEAAKHIDTAKDSPEEAARAAKARAALEKARGNLSTEGSQRLSLNIPTPASVPVSEPPVPGPQPRKAPQITPRQTDDTVITTGPDGTGLFDGNRKIAIFADATDGVVLDNPKIRIDCEELEIHFTGELHASDSAGEKNRNSTASAPDPMFESNSIEVAYARGKRVVLQKKHDDGKVQIGQCREAVYNGKTGDLELKIWPQIQENEHIVAAKAATTRILILRDGRLKFVGPTETRISNKP
jgi:hypothetical protein